MNLTNNASFGHKIVVAMRVRPLSPSALQSFGATFRCPSTTHRVAIFFLSASLDLSLPSILVRPTDTTPCQKSSIQIRLSRAHHSSGHRGSVERLEACRKAATACSSPLPHAALRSCIADLSAEHLGCFGLHFENP